jgi:hypothetical protein
MYVCGMAFVAPSPEPDKCGISDDFPIFPKSMGEPGQEAKPPEDQPVFHGRIAWQQQT